MTDTGRTARRGWRRIALKGGTLSDLWLYLRYQALSKLLLAVVVMPLYRLVFTALMTSADRTYITSGDFKDFALSLQGLGLALISTLLVGFLVVVDIAAFVIAELSRLRGTPIRTGRELLRQAIGSFPRVLHPGTFVLLCYIVVVVPLAGFGPTLDVLSWVKVPNFVTEFIVNDPRYLWPYVTVVVALGILSFFLSMTVPAMLARIISPIG